MSKLADLRVTSHLQGAMREQWKIDQRFAVMMRWWQWAVATSFILFRLLLGSNVLHVTSRVNVQATRDQQVTHSTVDTYIRAEYRSEKQQLKLQQVPAGQYSFEYCNS